MVWNPISPDGSKSVKANVTIQDQNTAYTETTMNNDHFWNIGANEDGHHQFVQTMATNDADKTIQTNPELSTDMDLVYYSRFKTALESVAQQDCQPFVKNIAGANPLFLNGVMQLLAIRACVVWNIAAGPDPTNQTIVYSHNVSTVARQIDGRYKINFTTAVPSDNYVAWGGGMGVSDNSTFNSLYGSVSSGASVAARKSTISCIFMMRNQAGTLANALQGWFVCFGG